MVAWPVMSEQPPQTSGCLHQDSLLPGASLGASHMKGGTRDGGAGFPPVPPVDAHHPQRFRHSGEGCEWPLATSSRNAYNALVSTVLRG